MFSMRKLSGLAHDPEFMAIQFRKRPWEWARVQRGFDALCRQFPNSLSARSEFCSISGFAPSGARTLMRNLFPPLGNRVDLSVWLTMEKYQRDRQWAFSDISGAHSPSRARSIE